MLVSALIVNYNRRELLAACLRSLAEALARVEDETEVIVVDNGSTDGSARLVEESFPHAVLLALPRNLGFSGGVVQGMGRAQGEWIALFNNDTTLHEDAVAAMLAAGRSADDVGAVAAQMRFADRPDVVNSAGMEMDQLGVAADRLVGAPVAAVDSQEPQEVFGATGGAALYRRAMLDQVGGFDETFFAFFEDADLAWRTRASGWRALYAPRAIVYHHHSATAGHGTPAKLYLVGRNRVRTLAKNANTSLLLRRGPYMLLYDAAYVAFASLRYRTLAPLRGRLQGLREWRSYRRKGRAARRPVQLAPPFGLKRALRRHRVWTKDDPSIAGRPGEVR